jgi:maleate cis-trans isomerase
LHRGRAAWRDARLARIALAKINARREMSEVLMKALLTMDELESQAALELPDREAPALVVIGCLAVCVGQIVLSVEDVNVAAQVCAQVTALSIAGQVLTCEIRGQR